MHNPAWCSGSLAYLAAQPIRKAMLVLLSPNIAHHVGLAVLVPGVVGVGFPQNFALLIAVGKPTVLLLLNGPCPQGFVSRLAAPVDLNACGVAYSFLSAYLALMLGAALVDKLHAHWYVSSLLHTAARRFAHSDSDQSAEKRTRTQGSKRCLKVRFGPTLQPPPCQRQTVWSRRIPASPSSGRSPWPDTSW